MANDEKEHGSRASTEYLAAGLGVGAFGVLGAVVGSAVCPVCIVATPALLGVGLYKRWRERAARASMVTAEPAPSRGDDHE
ncbi:MAG: hypothetical protein IT373_10450 [Polyangiaceae bacterium]|nr:hypothetical protein [Polyangiaceae bacterium]